MSRSGTVKMCSSDSYYILICYFCLKFGFALSTLMWNGIGNKFTVASYLYAHSKRDWSSWSSTVIILLSRSQNWRVCCIFWSQMQFPQSKFPVEYCYIVTYFTDKRIRSLWFGGQFILVLINVNPKTLSPVFDGDYRANENVSIHFQK